MFGGNKFFVTATKDFNRWIKMGFTLFQLGKALYDKSLGDAFGACKNLYDQYKQKEDTDFIAFISQPFLTSTEQDGLINQLRDGDPNFFDLFRYSAQAGNWACTKCHTKEGIQRGKIQAPSPAATSATPTPASPTPSSPSANPTSPLSPRSPMKVNIGMGPLKTLTNVIAILEGDKVLFYGAEKDIEKKKTKHEIVKSEIVAFAEIDERINKQKWNFKLVTLKRTYDCVAQNEADLQMWKKLLNKS